MRPTYQDAAPNSRKGRNRPLFQHSMPLSEEEWRHLLVWVERNYSRRVDQPLKEVMS